MKKQKQQKWLNPFPPKEEKEELTLGEIGKLYGIKFIKDINDGKEKKLFERDCLYCKCIMVEPCLL